MSEEETYQSLVQSCTRLFDQMVQQMLMYGRCDPKDVEAYVDLEVRLGAMVEAREGMRG